MATVADVAAIIIDLSRDNPIASDDVVRARALLREAARHAGVGAVSAKAFAGAARAAAWDALHTGDWRAAPIEARTLFSLAVSLETTLLLERAICADSADAARLLSAALRELDIALMLCPPHGDERSARAHDLSQTLIAAASLNDSTATQGGPPLPTLPRDLSCSIAAAADYAAAQRSITFNSVSRLASPTLRDFAAAAAQGPVIVEGSIEHWPALADKARLWESLPHLASVLRGRSAPVEVGAHYMARSWGENLVQLDGYLRDVIAPSVRATLDGVNVESAETQFGVGDVRYLAQAALFDQVPRLRDDICEPDLITALMSADADAASSEVRALAWLGPAGTFTPLHFDAPRNFLSQVFGVKRVRLHAPGAAPVLASLPSPLSNTSRLPPVALEADIPVSSEALEGAWARLASWRTAREQGRRGVVRDAASAKGSDDDSDAPDDTWPARFPEYASGAAATYEAVLRPGDVLYIPPGWWHSVRALTAACSVSFWF